MLGYNCTISLRLSSQAWDFSPILMIFSGISTVSELLGRLYYYDPITGNPGKLPTNVNNVVTVVALVGRKKVYGVTLIITVICAIGSGISFGSSAKSADFLWRIVLMLGALPAMLTFYWRTKMPETGRYTALIEGNAKKSAVDMGRVLDIDIAFYSQNLTQKDIFPAMGLTKQAADVSDYLYSFQSTRLRSTGHALSAAAGKAGAMIGAFVVQTYTLDRWGCYQNKACFVGSALYQYARGLFHVLPVGDQRGVFGGDVR
ncbi:hypothetical protein NC652_034441 [Populus alba x Populus x berolinensis]|nr:hypothetical protein NC652_034441 [Populus alba x Populus x berolinensis]